MYRENNAIKVMTMGSGIVDIVLSAEQMVSEMFFPTIFYSLSQQMTTNYIIYFKTTQLSPLLCPSAAALGNCGCHSLFRVSIVEQALGALRRPIGKCQVQYI